MVPKPPEHSTTVVRPSSSEESEDETVAKPPEHYILVVRPSSSQESEDETAVKPAEDSIAVVRLTEANANDLTSRHSITALDVCIDAPANEPGHQSTTKRNIDPPSQWTVNNDTYFNAIVEIWDSNFGCHNLNHTDAASFRNRKERAER